MSNITAALVKKKITHDSEYDSKLAPAASHSYERFHLAGHKTEQPA